MKIRNGDAWCWGKKAGREKRRERRRRIKPEGYRKQLSRGNKRRCGGRG